MFKNSILAISASFILAACGGSGGSNDGVTTATGQLKDSNTAGITYVSGDQSGTTDTDGSFTYEVGKTVTFSVGGITVGTSSGKSTVTPIDFVPGSSSGSLEVQNIVRFLLMLDDDGDPSNGINISPSILAVAENWSQVDFSAADFATGLTSIISDAASADQGIHALPDADEAQAHLEATLLCSYSGAYKGTYSGGDNGNFGFLINASNGNVAGVAYSIADDEYIGLSGTTPISYDQDVAFVSGDSTTGATFSGQFTSVNGVTGSWQNPFFSVNGSFSGSRIGGAADAVHRFTGNYIGDDFGLFSFDINSTNNVTGIAYSIAGDELLTVSGTISGTTLTATASDGTVIAGTLNTATGGLTGTWDDSAESLSGTFSGNGCQLN